jgi:uncharacterized protein YdhG (YjbR/CyaY superfamily)
MPFDNIDDYISGFPEEIQGILNKVRGIIKAAAPDAEETINYGIPTFRLHGNLVHFAANSRHLGFYPSPSALEVFKNELSGFGTSKGAVRFPYKSEIPYDLIAKIVIYRLEENLEKAYKKSAEAKSKPVRKADRNE